MNVSSRVTYLFNRLREIQPKVDAERAVLLTESYKSTIGEPYLTRRAKAVAHILENQSIGINPSELIVGMQTGVLGGVPVFPEMAVDWLEKELLSTESYNSCAGYLNRPY